MIKYTILYKNGKTWNGETASIYQIKAFDCLLLITQPLPGKFKIYKPFQNRSWAWVEDRTFFKNPMRKPNPASVTKKQKAFDKAYAEWKINNSNLVDYDDGSGYTKYAHVGNGDTSIKAYKKWLWEQKQVAPDGWIPWYGGKCPVPYDARVEVKFRCGKTNDRIIAGVWGWGKGDGSHSIVAYRLLDEDGKPVKYSKPLAEFHKQVGEVAESALPITLKLSYDTPIKTTYTFWLGAFGEISDEL